MDKERCLLVSGNVMGEIKLPVPPARSPGVLGAVGRTGSGGNEQGCLGLLEVGYWAFFFLG